MDRPIVSIIVPIYNVECYLEKCLTSLVKQTLSSLEIICVDDGSTDSSLKIVEKFAHIDERIRIISKKNSGYGDSVNQGIESAQGEYIGILESDDFASVNMYEVLCKKAMEHNAEVVKCNYYEYYSKADESIFFENLKDIPYETVSAGHNLVSLYYVAPSIWSAIYKRDFLLNHGIKFLKTVGASYQDVSFAFKVIMCSKKIILLKKALLYYRKDNMTSSINDSGKVFCVCNELDEIERFIYEKRLTEFLPIFTKLKYIRYLWNLNRISVEAKKMFLPKMYQEILFDWNRGLIVRNYWDEIEWKEVHELVCNTSEYCEKALYNNEVSTKSKSDEYTIFEMIKVARPLYVYGAGIRGNRVLNLLDIHNVKVAGILVTKKGNNPDYIREIPVCEIVKYKDINALIIIAVSTKLQKDVINTLKSYDLNNFILLDQNIIRIMEEEKYV